MTNHPSPHSSAQRQQLPRMHRILEPRSPVATRRPRCPLFPEWPQWSACCLLDLSHTCPVSTPHVYHSSPMCNRVARTTTGHRPRGDTTWRAQTNTHKTLKMVVDASPGSCASRGVLVQRLLISNANERELRRDELRHHLRFTIDAPTKDPLRFTIASF